MDVERRRAGGQLDRLADADRVAVGLAGPFHHQGDPPGVALDPGQIGAGDEIAALDVAAGGQVVERHVDRIEVIDQRLARMPVVDEQPVEPFLLEDDAVVDARRPVALRLIAVLRVDGVDDRLVIGFGPAVERGQDVDRRLPDVELVEVPALGRTDQRDQSRSFSSRTSWRASRLKSPTSSATRGPVLPSASSSALWAAIRLR